MGSMSPAAVQALQQNLLGELIIPGDARYEAVRKVMTPAHLEERTAADLVRSSWLLLTFDTGGEFVMLKSSGRRTGSAWFVPVACLIATRRHGRG